MDSPHFTNEGWPVIIAPLQGTFHCIYSLENGAPPPRTQQGGLGLHSKCTLLSGRDPSGSKPHLVRMELTDPESQPGLHHQWASRGSQGSSPFPPASHSPLEAASARACVSGDLSLEPVCLFTSSPAPSFRFPAVFFPLCLFARGQRAVSFPSSSACASPFHDLRCCQGPVTRGRAGLGTPGSGRRGPSSAPEGRRGSVPE